MNLDRAIDSTSSDCPNILSYSELDFSTWTRTKHLIQTHPRPHTHRLKIQSINNMSAQIPIAVGFPRPPQPPLHPQWSSTKTYLGQSPCERAGKADPGCCCQVCRGRLHPVSQQTTISHLHNASWSDVFSAPMPSMKPRLVRGMRDGTPTRQFWRTSRRRLGRSDFGTCSCLRATIRSRRAGPTLSMA